VAQLDDNYDGNDGGGDLSRSFWEDRLSEFDDSRKIHAHCKIDLATGGGPIYRNLPINYCELPRCIVPRSYSENIKLGKWAGNQRCQYKLHLEKERDRILPFPVFRNWKASVSNGTLSAPPEKIVWASLPITAKYTGTAMFLNATERTPSWVHGSQPRGVNTARRKDIIDDHLPYPGTGKHGFRMEAIGRGNGIAKKPSLDDDGTCFRERTVEVL
jgi:hypothetical protein